MTPATAFTKLAAALPDLTPYYKWSGWTTGGTVAVVPLVSADMNADGLDDIAVHFAQFQSGGEGGNWGKVFFGPTPNELVIFLAQPDGTFRDGTAEVFGTTAPIILPGISRKADRGDLNGDGRPDWVYVVNKEDGRSGNNLASIESQSAVILSQPDGGYAVVTVGAPDWYHAARIFESGGAMHLLMQGFAGPQKDVVGSFADVYAYTNEDFVLNEAGTGFVSAGKMPANASTFVVLPPEEAGQAASQIFLIGSGPGASFSYPTLVERKGAGDWEITSSVSFNYEAVPFVTWTGAAGTNNAAEVDGYRLFMVGFSESALLRPSPGQDQVIVVQLTSQVIEAPRSDGYYYENDGQPLDKLMFYAIVDGQLVEAPITITGEQVLSNYNFFEVLDLNADGLEDIAAYPYVYDLRPDVYLNLGNGELRHLDPSVLPQGPQWGSKDYPAGSSKFLDANGDGFYDLLYFASNALPQYSIPQWELHLGTGPSMADFDTSAIVIADRHGGTLLTTWGGNDTITDVNASANPTHIDGGLGIDTAHYSGARAGYTVSALPSAGWSVKGPGIIDDTLQGVERLAFSDTHLALDIEGNAGIVAKLMGAVFGSAIVHNPYYMGIALSVVDGGVSFEQGVGLALDVMLGANAPHAQVVSLLYANLAGVAPTPEQSAPLVAWLDQGVLTPAQLAVYAAEHPVNLLNIDFAGLQAHGLAFDPY